VLNSISTIRLIVTRPTFQVSMPASVFLGATLGPGSRRRIARNAARRRSRERKSLNAEDAENRRGRRASTPSATSARFSANSALRLFCLRRPLRRGFGARPVFHEIVDHRRVGEGGDIAEVADVVLGHLAQDAAHDLAGAGLGQTRGEL